MEEKKLPNVTVDVLCESKVGAWEDDSRGEKKHERM